MPTVFESSPETPGAKVVQGPGQEETDWSNRPPSLPFGASDWPPRFSSPPSWRPQAVPLFLQPSVTDRKTTHTEPAEFSIRCQTETTTTNHNHHRVSMIFFYLQENLFIIPHWVSNQHLWLRQIIIA